MTRQAVSKQVLRLERELGAELFIRTTTRVEITPAGKLFAEYYMEQAERFDAVCRRVEQISGGSSSIRIGYLYGIEIDSALYEVTKNYRKRHQLSPLQWKRGNPLDLVQDVQNGTLDIAITFTDDQTLKKPGLRVQSIGRVQMVVAVSQKNPLVETAVSAKDFEKETFYAWNKHRADYEIERGNIIRHGKQLGLDIEHVELLANYGVEGLTFEMVAGKPAFTDIIRNNPEGMNLDVALTLYTCGTGSICTVVDNDKNLSLYSDLQNAAVESWRSQVDNENIILSVSMTPDEASEYYSLMSDNQTYYEQAVPEFIMGNRPLAEFDAYVDTMNSMGLDHCIELYQTAYDRFMGKGE